MQAQHIIQLLSSDELTCHHTALNIIDRKMKVLILSTIGTPPYIDKDEIWNLALHALWKHISLDAKAFDCSQPDSIQRFLRKVCWIQMLKQVEQHTTKKKYFQPIEAWQQVVADDVELERILLQIDKMDEIQSFLTRYLGPVAQQIIVNRYYHKMTYEEMSRQMGKTSQNLRTIKCRALIKLKGLLYENLISETQLKILLNQYESTQ